MTVLQFMALGLGSALFLEGIFYALFTKSIKGAMADLFALPDRKIQMIGLIIAIAGFVILVAVFSSVSGA